MFKQRTTPPDSSCRWYRADNPFAWAGYGMPNCTAYAWGRAAELIGSAPRLSTGNAENWWAHPDGYQRGSIPALGAVACWSKGKPGDSSDGSGHVAIVEQINADGSIVTSESGWKSSLYWWRKTRQRGSGNWGQDSGYSFQGFIYLPIGSAPAQPVPVLQDVALPILRPGDRGEAVRAMQLLLIGAGHPCGELGADGAYGNNTRKALEDFQREKNLTADGICGSASWRQLLGV